jgi:hypothetical protein
MRWLWRLLRGGFLAARRAEILGLAAGLAGIIKALANWAVGDLTLAGLIGAALANWPLIAGGAAFATLGAKIGRRKQVATSGESVSEIADRALRR